MCYLIDGAQDHIRTMDFKPIELEHRCDACQEGFDSGFGVSIGGDEKFCNDCIAKYNHFEFYKNNGVSDVDIYEITKNIIKL